MLRAAVRYRKADGTLTLTEDGQSLIWSPGEAAAGAKQASWRVSSIVAHQQSKPDAARVILRVITDREQQKGPVFHFAAADATTALDQRNQFRDALVQLAAQGAEGGGDAHASDADAAFLHSLAQLTSPLADAGAAPVPTEPCRGNAELLSGEEAQQRADLLARSPQLRDLHQELVLTGVVSDADFWAARHHMLAAEAARARSNKRGVASSTVTNLRSSIHTSSGEMRFKLTHRVIERIFLEHPAVRRAYQDMVPHKLSEQTFWEKYLASHYFSDTGAASPAASAAAAGGSADSSAASFRERDVFESYKEQDDEAERASKRRRLTQLPTTLDLRLSAPAQPGFGLAPDSSMRSISSSRLPMLRRVNRHGQVVLQQLAGSEDVADATVAKKKSARPAAWALPTQRDTELEAEAEPDVQLLVLTQQGSRAFGQRVGEAAAAPPAESPVPRVLTDKPAAVQKVSSALDLCDATAAMAIAQRVVQTSALHGGTVDQAGVVRGIDLPLDLQRQIRAAFSKATELLRHFWAGYATARGTGGAAKLDKIVQLLIKLKERLLALRSTLPARHMASASSIIAPLVDLLTHAIGVYEKRVAK